MPVDHEAAGQSIYGNQQSLNARVIESPVDAIEFGYAPWADAVRANANTTASGKIRRSFMCDPS